jgi:hypothetical protein
MTLMCGYDLLNDQVLISMSLKIFSLKLSLIGTSLVPREIRFFLMEVILSNETMNDLCARRYLVDGSFSSIAFALTRVIADVLLLVR